MRFRTDAIFPARGTGAMSHCSTFVELPDGSLLAAWMTGSFEPAPDQHLATVRRPAGAHAWEPPVPLPQSHGRIEGQPVFLFDESSVLWLYGVCLVGADWTTARIHRRRSYDLGRTWGEAEDLCLATGWMLRSRPIKLGPGRWLLPAYDEVRWRSIILHSENDGRTWTPSQPIESDPGNIHACLIPGAVGGELMTYCRSGGIGGWTWLTRSLDGGWTWDRPQPTAIPNPNSGLDVIRMQAGPLIMAYNNSHTDRSPLCLIVSHDDGESWSLPRTVARGNGEFSYPTLLEGAKGLVRMTYTDRRETIRYAEFDLEWIHAVDPSDT